ncbi:hypothetical protein D3C81_1114730 [compost metagenome]
MQQVERGAALLRREPGQQAVFAEQVAHQPTAIAPGCAEAGKLGFDDGDAQGRRELFQVVGGPQPGVAGADDRDIDIQVFAQRRARGQRFFKLVHPQADIAPCRHC